MIRKTETPQTVILLFLISFATVGSAFVAAAIPGIATTFGVSVSAAQWVITFFLAGYALGNLVWGPLSSSIGRRRMLITGLFVEVTGTLFCLAAAYLGAFHLLLAARVVEGFGASIGFVATLVMIADSFSGDKARRTMGYAMTSFAIAPALSLLVGGIVTQHLGWISCFWGLLFYGFLLLFLILLLPETLEKRKRCNFHMGLMVRGYGKTVAHREFLAFASLGGLSKAISYAYITGSPFIAIHLLGASPSRYGLWSLIPNMGYLCGAFLAGKLAGRSKPVTLVFTGWAVGLGGAIICLFLFQAGKVSLWTLFPPLALALGGAAMVSSNANALAMGSIEDKGLGSGFLAFLQIGLAGMGSAAMSLFHSGSALPLPSVVIGLLIVMIAIIFTTRRDFH